MSRSATEIAEVLFGSATPVLQVHRLDPPLWKRKIDKNPRDLRTGPWLQARFTVVNDHVWRKREACLYLVKQGFGPVRYVGISRNGVRHRWRTSPAYDPLSMTRLPNNQLFHSQCWRHMQLLALQNPTIDVEVRTITRELLCPTLTALGPPLSGFLPLGEDGEGLCAAVERWLCNRRSGDFLSWNTAMTSSTTDGTKNSDHVI
jgi:hypothetical protein